MSEHAISKKTISVYESTSELVRATVTNPGGRTMGASDVQFRILCQSMPLEDARALSDALQAVLYEVDGHIESHDKHVLQEAWRKEMTDE
jgi:hypothetical protein